LIPSGPSRWQHGNFRQISIKFNLTKPTKRFHADARPPAFSMISRAAEKKTLLPMEEQHASHAKPSARGEKGFFCLNG
jgi:hypothetical protein